MQIEIRKMNAEDIVFFHEDIYRLMQICLANSLPDKFEHTFIEEKIIVLKEYLYQNKAYVFVLLTKIVIYVDSYGDIFCLAKKNDFFI